MRIPYPGTGTVVETAEHRWLRGRWLLVGRAGWVSMTVCSVGLFLLAIPERYGQLSHLSAGLRDTLTQLGVTVQMYAAFSLAADALCLIGSVLIAWLILSRTSTEPLALFVSLFLVSIAASSSATIAALAAHHRSVDAFTTLLGALGYIGLFGLFYLFPDGRFVPRWTRFILAVAIVLQVPYSLPASSHYDPNSWPPPLKAPLLLGIFGSAIFAQIYRYRRVSDAMRRQQTKWVVCGATAAIVLMFVARSGDPNSTFGPSVSIMPLIRGPLLDMAFLLIPLSLAFSMLRYRLWDIDIIINRTLVYGGLTVSFVGLYVLIVGYLGTVLRIGNNLGVSLVATGAVAVLFQYLREQLQRGVNRLMYGDRDDPYAALSGLGKRLEATLAPNDALPTIVDTIAQALKLPYVSVALLQDDVQVAGGTYGSLVDNVVSLPLSYGSDIVGELVLGLRTGEAALSPADRRLLEDLARQAGVVAYAVRLTADLQRSRERLVSTREEERRRLRRDLHDGLGPALGAFSLKLGAARNVLPTDQAAADALLAELIDDVEEAVGDIRRLVYNLRPPSLDELGLVGAIRAQVARYDAGAGRAALRVRLDAPDDLAPLPAALEVAAYRIVLEALANVARHSRARTCGIRLTSASNTLQIVITDDGVGLPPAYHPGIGLGSMRERAEEMGGTLTVESLPGSGMRVLADLPFQPANR